VTCETSRLLEGVIEPILVQGSLAYDGVLAGRERGDRPSSVAGGQGSIPHGLMAESRDAPVCLRPKRTPWRNSHVISTFLGSADD